MRQAVEIFDGYGSRHTLEKRLNDWLHAEERDILGVQATQLRLFIHWRPSTGSQRRDALFIRLFKTLPNGSDPAEQFATFFKEHPGVQIAHRAENDSFLFWFFRDGSD